METNTLQIILYVLFGAFVVIGFGALALFGFFQKQEANTNTQERTASVVLWGTLPGGRFQEVAKQLSKQDQRFTTISYIEKNPATVQGEYIAAIAVNEQPDLLLLDHETILTLEQTLQPIPFPYYPLSQFQQDFIEPASVFIRRGSGYVAIPFLVDTMVLYYNENLRLQAAIQFVPTVWSAFTRPPYPELSAEYIRSTPVRSIIPLGGYKNFGNATDLFSALLLQTRETSRTLSPEALSSSLSFYTSFGNAQASTFSWKPTFPEARALFTGGRLLYYPGFLSEYALLKRQNPNLVIRAAPLPQLQERGVAVTPARLYAFAVPKTSRESNAAISVAYAFLSTLYEGGTSTLIPEAYDLFGLPPALRRLTPTPETTALEATFLSSVFSARVLPLSQEKRASLIEVLQGVSSGVFTPEQGSAFLLESVVQ